MAGAGAGRACRSCRHLHRRGKAGSLLSIAEQVCQKLDIGFRVRFDQQAKKLLFELYRPKLDPNARYAPQYGNLTGLTYTESITDYKNIVTVAGADGTVTVGATGNTGSARRELYLDATSKKKKDGQSQEDYSGRAAGAG